MRHCWPARAQRTLTLVVTGNTRGFLESCGCSGKKSPALAHRVGFAKRMRDKLPPALLVDIGDLAADPSSLDPVAAAMKAAPYDAVAQGPGDAALGECYAEAVQRHKLPAVPIADAAAGYRALVAQAGDIRVSFLAASPLGDPVAAATTAIAAATTIARGCDLAVVLCRSTAAQLQRALPAAPDHSTRIVVLGAGTDRSVCTVGGLRFVAHDMSPSVAGILTLRLGEGGIVSAAWRMSAVPESGAADPAATQIVAEHFAKLQDEVRLREARSLALEPASLGYTPARRCGQCHPAQLTRWQQSGHAGALSTLSTARRLVPECLKCHSEHFRRTGALPAAGDQGDGVQCASCHGDGVLHSLLQTGDTIARSVSDQACRLCHTKEKSPQFSPRAYRARARH